jgi:hypothetical protein
MRHVRIPERVFAHSMPLEVGAFRRFVQRAPYPRRAAEARRLVEELFRIPDDRDL